MPLLEIRNLTVEFAGQPRPLVAVTDVSLSVASGEALCLVGESGAGKSVLTQAITRLVPSPPAHYSGGNILLENRDVLRMPEQELRSVRGRMVAYVFQEPRAALNPSIRIGRQVKDVLGLHHPQKANDSEVVRLLDLVGLPDALAHTRYYPPQLSGGMLQRVALALALACEPKLLIADEPTGSLDVTTQSQILDLFQRIRKELNLGLIFITHNSSIVPHVADRIAVMYAGRLVEVGSCTDVLGKPLHPYTQGLLGSAVAKGALRARFATIPGAPPTLDSMPAGCCFHPRCFKAQSLCGGSAPLLQEAKLGHLVRCPFWNESPTGEVSR